MSFEGFPFIIGWELTLGCNLRCRHCGSGAGAQRTNELSTQECIAICDQFPPLLVQEVNFTGGEPLLRPDWHVVCSHLGELGIATKIITNGLSLTANTLEKLRSVGIAGIGVSVDGLEPTHDYVRGYPGLYRRVVEGVRRAIEAGFDLTVITTIHALNVAELPSILDELAAMGVQHWQVQPIFPLGRGKAALELRLTREAYVQLGAFVRQYEETARRKGVELLPGDSYGYFTDLDARTPPWRGCPAGLFSCGITSNGKVKGCLSLPDDFIEGDLRKRDLWDIWFDPNAFAYTRNYCSSQLGENCRSCELAEQCRGGCTAMSYGNTQRVHNDPYCFYGFEHRNYQLHSIESPLFKGSGQADSTIVS